MGQCERRFITKGNAHRIGIGLSIASATKRGSTAYNRRDAAFGLAASPLRSRGARRGGAMDKREFLKVSGGFVTASMLPDAWGQQHEEPRTNWAGNYTYSTDHVHTPASLDE